MIGRLDSFKKKRIIALPKLLSRLSRCSDRGQGRAAPFIIAAIAFRIAGIEKSSLFYELYLLL